MFNNFKDRINRKLKYESRFIIENVLIIIIVFYHLQSKNYTISSYKSFFEPMYLHLIRLCPCRKSNIFCKGISNNKNITMTSLISTKICILIAYTTRRVYF